MSNPEKPAFQYAAEILNDNKLKLRSEDPDRTIVREPKDLLVSVDEMTTRIRRP